MRLVTEHLDPWLTDTGTKVAIELGTCTQIDHDVARSCRDYYCAKHSTNQLLLFKTTDNPKYFSTYRCNENVLPSTLARREPARPSSIHTYQHTLFKSARNTYVYQFQKPSYTNNLSSTNNTSFINAICRRDVNQ